MVLVNVLNSAGGTNNVAPLSGSLPGGEMATVRIDQKYSAASWGSVFSVPGGLFSSGHCRML